MQEQGHVCIGHWAVSWACLPMTDGHQLAAQIVKNLPAMWETWVQPLDQEDPLEKGMATHSSILAWRIPWTEKPGGHPWVAKSDND